LNRLNLLTPLNRRDVVIAVALFVYVLAMRTYDVATTFLMLGEQTRDWTIALGGITDLPLVGAPSTAGGRGFGPAYYYLLWLGRVTIGPFMDNLPHAGGVTVALLQSIADAWLFLALSRRIHWALALATCLLIASGPFDIAISSVIWNPPVAEALIKMAIAMALTMTVTSPAWHIVLTAGLAWTAVQAHLSAIFVAAPLLLGVAIQPLLHHRRVIFAHDTVADQRRVGVMQSLACIAIVVAVIAVLQIPFLISLVSEPSAPAGPSGALATIASGQAWRPMAALESVTGISGNLFLPLPETFKFWIAFAVAGLIVLAVYRRDAIYVGASVGAILTATIIFSTWTRGYDRYWFLPLVPALALVFLGPIAAIPWRPVQMAAGLALTVWFGIWQPARIEQSKAYFEYPQYDTMVRGSREIVMRAPAVRDIKVAFDVHPTMDRHFIYTILGGRIDGSALYTAVINADGTVRLE
jgi:hypothetical protein